jgi:esterase/lipase
MIVRFMITETMSGVIYITPGYQKSVRQKCYQVIAKIFRKRGIKPVFVNIHWKNRTLTDYVFQLLTQIKKARKNHVYLFGFSLGAMVACIAASLINPKKIYLCSLSPYFKEDLTNLETAERRILGEKRVKDFSRYEFKKVARQISCKTILFVGDKEARSLLKRASLAEELIQQARVIRIKNANHDLGDPGYLKAVLKRI